MDGFWDVQEEFESGMGWNTKERITRAEDAEEARLEELNYSLYRAFAETVEMYHEATGISLDNSMGERTTDEQYDRLGYEAVDMLLFLKKAGDTLNQDIETYLDEETSGRDFEDNDLEGILEPDMDPEIRDEDHRIDEIKTRAEELVEEIGPRDIDSDNLYDEFREIYSSEDYSSDRELGNKLASSMLDVVEMMEHLPRETSEYFREKQRENRERLESGEDFGEGSGDYGKTPDWILKPEDEETEPAYINLVT